MEILVLFILTLLNGFFALSEIALVSVKRSRIEQKAAEGSYSAQTVLQLLEDPENFLSAVQVGITLIGIVAGAYGGAALSDDLLPVIAAVAPLAPYAPQLSIVIVIGLITYFTIVVGELLPKTIALNNPDGIALAVAPIIKAFTVLTFPLVKLFSGSTSLLTRLLGIKKQDSEASLTEEELRHMIRIAGKEGVLEKEEQRIHDNIFYLYEQRNRSLMTYRTDVEWLDLNWTPEQIQEAISRGAHTKFPVCQGDLDNVVGVLSVKDYFECISRESVQLQSILSKPIFLSEHMLAMNTLKLFQQKRQYLAFVVNEFGSIVGIITLHDIMEAIVGDLPDVNESLEPDVFIREDGTYLVSGSTQVYHLNQTLGLELIPNAPEHYSTLAGFILYELSNIPQVGTKLTVADFELEVMDMDGSRIDKVLLSPIAPLPEKHTAAS
ncbi:putative hemolysin [Pontibacter ummariensis]|uniref:Putative hemolysin n=1 Tax=Pontibacter ummariensis TaxID=1610492 RepID=A0A239HE53_9BACT|nr:hemolysin family protein [Pontibacter ummariensis]PRY10672.1 putative hemolysin [Pontibacter ummariensis]SNS78534.1 putative hemolysin [Pontibacter ummariensis]